MPVAKVIRFTARIARRPAIVATIKREPVTLTVRISRIPSIAARLLRTLRRTVYLDPEEV